jgi:hypothetical protein
VRNIEPCRFRRRLAALDCARRSRRCQTAAPDRHIQRQRLDWRLGPGDDHHRRPRRGGARQSLRRAADLHSRAQSDWPLASAVDRRSRPGAAGRPSVRGLRRSARHRLSRPLEADRHSPGSAAGRLGRGRLTVVPRWVGRHNWGRPGARRGRRSPVGRGEGIQTEVYRCGRGDLGASPHGGSGPAVPKREAAPARPRPVRNARARRGLAPPSWAPTGSLQVGPQP